MVGHIIYTNKFSTDIEEFQKVAENENLSKNDLRVFIFLCCRVGSKHSVKIDRSQISEYLCITKSKVDECLDNLEKNDIIIRCTDEHVKNGYRMVYTTSP